jgi:hypothetical protein
LKTNHQSTGWPLVKRGTGASASCAANKPALPIAIAHNSRHIAGSRVLQGKCFTTWNNNLPDFLSSFLDGAGPSVGQRGRKIALQEKLGLPIEAVLAAGRVEIESPHDVEACRHIHEVPWQGIILQ